MTYKFNLYIPVSISSSVHLPRFQKSEVPTRGLCTTCSVFLACSFFKKKKFIYLFIYFWLCCCVWAFSSCVEQGLLFVAVHRLLIAVASLVVEHGLQARGLQ